MTMKYSRYPGWVDRAGLQSLYGRWREMRGRCTRKTAAGYENYGGRGIVVCAEWQAFRPFADWALANGYAFDLTLERRENDGNYEPDNCRWATRKEQALNQRRTRRDALGTPLVEVARANGIEPATFFSRISRGCDPLRAAELPLGSRLREAQSNG